MTFLVLLDDTKEIVSRSLVWSALNTDLLNRRLEANNNSNVHPTVQAEIMRNIEEKQTARNLHKLKHQQQTSTIDRTHAHLDPDFASDDSTYDETTDVPNNFVHLRDDGEFNASIHLEKPVKDAPLWKEFKAPLLDKDGKEQLDTDGNPITAIVRDPKSLHSTVFLTDPDDNGEQHRAHVVEIIGN